MLKSLLITIRIVILFVLLFKNPAFSQSWQAVGPEEEGQATSQVNLFTFGVNKNTPYVVFANAGDHDNIVIRRLNSGRTFWETVGTTGFSGGKFAYPSIAFHDDVPYIAYSDETQSGKATVKRLNASGTTWETVGLSGFTAGRTAYTNITFVGNTLYMAFSDNTNSNQASVMRFNVTAVNSQWESVAASGLSVGKANFTTIGSDGTSPYILFSDEGDAKRATLKRLSADETNWEVVGTSGFSVSSAYSPAMAFNGTIPYVSFGNSANNITVMRLKADRTGWEVVGTSSVMDNTWGVSSPGVSSSIAIHNGSPYVFHLEGNHANGFVKRLNALGTEWENVGDARSFYHILDGPPIIQFSGNTGYIAYLNRSLSRTIIRSLSDGETKWEQVGLSSISRDSAYNASLTLNNHVPYLLYSDPEENYRGFLKRTGSSNNTWEVVGGGAFSESTTYHTSVAFEGDKPYVAYTEWEQNAKIKVKCLNSTGTGWEQVGPDVFEGPGSLASLAISGVTPYVCYVDRKQSPWRVGVKHLNASGTSWEIVGGTYVSDKGSEGSMFLGEDNIPYVICRDYSNGPRTLVKRLSASGTGWEVVGPNISDATTYRHYITINNGRIYILYSLYDVNDWVGYIKRLSVDKQQWEPVGPQISSDIIDLAFLGSIPVLAISDLSNDGRLSVLKLNAAETAWENLGGLLSSNILSVSLRADDRDLFVAYANPYAFVKKISLQTLPVSFLNLAVKQEGAKAKLEWGLLSEHQNEYFEISRSRDGSNFTFLSRVKSIGDTDSKRYYTAYDFNPLPGLSYYRLSQKDKNGAISLLGTKSVFINSFEKDIELYPNPTSGSISLYFKPYIYQQFEVLNSKGERIIFGAIKANMDTLRLDGSQLAAGLYWVKLIGKKHSAVKQFIKY